MYYPDTPPLDNDGHYCDLHDCWVADCDECDGCLMAEAEELAGLGEILSNVDDIDAAS